MCAIVSVLPSPTNPAEANATNYTVSVDGESVPYRNADFVSSYGIRHSTLVYQSSCSTHRISISANNMCGESPGTYEIVLDPELRWMLNVDLTNTGGNIECRFHASSSKYNYDHFHSSYNC